MTKTDSELPLVEGDQVQLQQVLLNLLVNSFEAMGETPLAERRVIIRSERESDGRVRVSVRDFGIGLPAKNPERVFEHFFSTKREGLGMGLAIARSIVSSHGGELAAVNAEGGGTCVYFSLPAVAGARHEQRELRVFVVDDDQSVRASLAALLESDGYTGSNSPRIAPVRIRTEFDLRKRETSARSALQVSRLGTIFVRRPTCQVSRQNNKHEFRYFCQISSTGPREWRQRL